MAYRSRWDWGTRSLLWRGCGGWQPAVSPRRTEPPRTDGADLGAELARLLRVRARWYLSCFPPTVMPWKDCGGNMTVGDIPIAGSNQETSRTFHLDKLSRTGMAAAQMGG